MADVHESAILEMTPDPDGARTVFYTPGPFKAGTLRVIANGHTYPPDDDRWGWTEIADDTIEFVRAPRKKDVLQYFAQERDGTTPSEIENVIGSPFHPHGVLP